MGEYGEGGTKTPHNSEEVFQLGTPTCYGVVQSVAKILGSQNWSLVSGCLLWNHRSCAYFGRVSEPKFSRKNVSAGLLGKV